jgi:hypothetical protein
MYFQIDDIIFHYRDNQAIQYKSKSKVGNFHESILGIRY